MIGHDQWLRQHFAQRSPFDRHPGYDTAAVLGGISFKGGEGTITGLLTGVLIIGVLNNALQLLSLGDYYQMVVKGLVLLAAVGFDTYQKNRKASKSRKNMAKGAAAA